MNENYYALYISIKKGCSPEIAFELLDDGKVKIKKEYMQDIIEMKKSMTYKQIGNIFGVTDNTIYRIMKKQKSIYNI